MAMTVITQTAAMPAIKTIQFLLNLRIGAISFWFVY